jgi:proline iminopeptidase
VRHGDYVSSDRLKLHYREEGEGPPLLLLAGGPGMDAAYMDTVLDQLKSRFRVILPDQRGTGRSARADAAAYDMGLYVQDVEDLRRHIGVERWNLVGHSWGAWLGEAYAAENPERVRRMVLVGACGPGISFLQPALDNLKSRMTFNDLERAKRASSPDWILRDADAAASENARASMPCFFYDRSVGQSYRDSQTGTFSTAGVFGAVMGKLAEASYDLLPKLRTLTIPTRVVHGDYDHIPAGFPASVADAMPNATLTLLDRCGHFPWIEQPEEFYRSVFYHLCDS